MIRIPRLPEPGEQGPVWDTRTLTPPSFRAGSSIDVEGGSTAPKNMPQQIQLATQMLQQTFGNDPDVDQKALKRRAFELFGMTIRRRSWCLGAAAEPGHPVKYGQSGFYWAQSLEKIAALDPSRAQPDPTQALKTSADMVKTGAQMAHDQSKAETQHQHDLAKAELQAKQKPQKPAPKRR
jgi:hypothetical protein